MAFYQWNGSSWVIAPEKKVWDGSAWVDVKGAKIWNGSAWKEYLNLEVTNESIAVTGGGGKGTAYYRLDMDGYNSVPGTYTDYNAYYNLSYSTFGSHDGDLRGFPVTECWYSVYTNEAIPDAEYTMQVSVTGNLTGSYALYVDGQYVAGPAKAGTYNSGTNRTTFRWFSYEPYVGSDFVTTGGSPFGGGILGSNGNKTNAQLL